MKARNIEADVDALMDEFLAKPGVTELVQQTIEWMGQADRIHGGIGDIFRITVLDVMCEFELGDLEAMMVLLLVRRHLRNQRHSGQ